jgi:subfamily B ATP-binding cassette protein MsbA
MHNLWRILSYIRNYRSFALLNVLFNILTVAFSLFSVMMIVPFMQLLFGKIPMVMEAPQFSWTAESLFAYF